MLGREVAERLAPGRDRARDRSPVPRRAFDALLANFVIAHFTKYKTALFDMKRVLRPGGRLG